MNWHKKAASQWCWYCNAYKENPDGICPKCHRFNKPAPSAELLQVIAGDCR
jgi:Zn finger protein HypA/HybF involved in hydrogenase expression